MAGNCANTWMQVVWALIYCGELAWSTGPLALLVARPQSQSVTCLVHFVPTQAAVPKCTLTKWPSAVHMALVLFLCLVHQLLSRCTLHYHHHASCIMHHVLYTCTYQI